MQEIQCSLEWVFCVANENKLGASAALKLP